MSFDPFEEFKKKKEEKKSAPEVDNSFYEIPTQGVSGDVGGLTSHRFETKDSEVNQKPSGFEATRLGDALKEEKPVTNKPKGFTATSLTENIDE